MTGHQAVFTDEVTFDSVHEAVQNAAKPRRPKRTREQIAQDKVDAAVSRLHMARAAADAKVLSEAFDEIKGAVITLAQFGRIASSVEFDAFTNSFAALLAVDIK